MPENVNIPESWNPMIIRPIDVGFVHNRVIYEVYQDLGNRILTSSDEIIRSKVIEKMKKKKNDKDEIGREEFLKHAWAWKEEYGGAIINQLKKLGSSCDWDRERFTMDEGCSDAVLEVFVKLYEKGYIYKGSRIINWCPVCQTSISDAEVEHQEQDGFFWHIN